MNFKSLQLVSNIFIKFLPKRSKFVYSCSVKKKSFNSGKALFASLLVVGAFSLQKVVEMLEEVLVGW